jgi:hypothetical protein
LVNLGLLAGFSRDSINAEYLASCGAAGVISTHVKYFAQLASALLLPFSGHSLWIRLQ